ncbi:MAG: DUF1684 domain-containing protein [Candidatus Aminicenantales bacterium]
MKTIKKWKIFICLGLLASFSALTGTSLIYGATAISEKQKENFEKEEIRWREERERQMRSPTSWLTIAGLFWLDEGKNAFGSDPSNKIRLPSYSSPASAGWFILKKGKVKVVAEKGVELKLKGKKIKKSALKGDDQGEPDVVELGRLKMWVIKRGERYAIRLRDPEALGLKNYTGLDFFPPSEKFRIEAEFVPYPEGKKLRIKTIINTENEMASPGYVKFSLDGKEYHLDVFGNPSNKRLFIIFKDGTNGKETYEPGRFLRAKIMDNGKVDLNFNRAYNPPCAYTPYATCPLAPLQNWLKVRIEAGEKKYPGSKH